MVSWWLRWGRGPYLDYYRHLVDKGARVDPRATVGGMWQVIGKLQLDFLRSQGLRPEHTLLDLGCGCLRGGLHFIPYLDPGHYWGLDISPEILEAGRRVMYEAELVDREPRLLLNQGFSLDEVAPNKFDFVLAFGIFPDVPAEVIQECFARLHKVLSPEGVFFATFRLADRRVTDPIRVRFRYPWSFFEELGRQTGYSVELVKGFTHPRGHSMLAVRHQGIGAVTR